MNTSHDIQNLVNQFRFSGKLVGAMPFGSGHINDTYCVTCEQDVGQIRYIIQRINHKIFKNPAAVMENIQRVTEHLGRKFAGDPQRGRRVLTLIPTRDGRLYYQDEAGDFWRAYLFLERARTFDVVESPLQAFAAAKAFGQFQKLLADLSGPRLHDTIPDFHHTPKRFNAWEKTLAADVMGRAKSAKAEIEFAFKHKATTSVLINANLPERVTHNDAKLNNVMLDDVTGEGLCVIDLDTVMPGLALYDFGDLIRTMTSPAKEGEQDLSKITMQFPMFEALARGYLASASGFLTREEKALLAFSGRLITFETGLRFLTDYLAGDTYFKVHRESHNLERCRAQFKLVASIAQQEDQMNRLVALI